MNSKIQHGTNQNFHWVEALLNVELFSKSLVYVWRTMWRIKREGGIDDMGLRRLGRPPLLRSAR